MEKFVNLTLPKSLMRFFLLGSLLIVSGCTTVYLPNYIQAKHPYVKRFAADFQSTLEAVETALEEKGWEIVDRADPTVFERSAQLSAADNRTLLFVEERQTSLMVMSRYAHLNVIIVSISEQTTEVELRYEVATSYPFKTFYGYKNDPLADNLFEAINTRIKP